MARVAAAATVFGIAHSLLASRRAKQLAERVLGDRDARGVYRLAYNTVSIGMTLGLAAYVLRRRGPVVYEVGGPAALLLRAGQAAALAVAARSAADAGFADLSGFGPAWRRLTGAPLAPAPDGQGPAEVAPGDPDIRGVFARTRNPLNAIVIPVLWLAPRATAGRLALNAVFTAYSVFGSWHANAMLAARHGDAWTDYEEYVPLMLPRGG